MAINYYEHHLGDYVRDTTHLSMLEEGAYLRLLHQYYIREKPLPAEPKECWRLARAATKPEQKAVDYVLAQFFDLREDGFHQQRTDLEIERFRSRSAKAKASSLLGVEARRSKLPNGEPNGEPNGHANGHPFDIPNGEPNGLPLQSPVSNPSESDTHAPTSQSRAGLRGDAASPRKNKNRVCVEGENSPEKINASR
jgi:uncharacterized protein YdaU (DUF1376 family)